MPLTPKQQALVKDFRDAGSRIDEDRDLRRNIARGLVAEIGTAEASRELGLARQSVTALLEPDSPRAAKLVLKQLVDSGLLPGGTQLVINRRTGRSLEAWVESDGRIRIGDGESARYFTTPSAASRALMGQRSADGWLRFRVETDEGFQTLDQLRERLAARG